MIVGIAVIVAYLCTIVYVIKKGNNVQCRESEACGYAALFCISIFILILLSPIVLTIGFNLIEMGI